MVPGACSMLRRFEQWYRTRAGEERGAEMVEFAFVVVLLVALLYGIISYGLILSAQSTVTQAAADGHPPASSRHPPLWRPPRRRRRNDIGWMNKGACATSGTTITCNASEAPCPSNASNECLTVTVSYQYNASPAVSLVARHGHRDSVDHLVDGRAPALEPELVVMRTVMTLRPRTTGRSCRSRDERGATFVLTAICMVLLMWGGAMGVDLGFTVATTRQAQAVADTGALDVARYINLANALTSLAASNTYLSGKLANARPTTVRPV